MVLRKRAGRSAIFIASLALLLVLGCWWPLAAQEGEESPPAGETAGEETEASAIPIESKAPYAYNVAGRRDPFKSLLERTPEGTGPRPEGLPGIQISEVDVLGVVSRTDGSFVAIIKGAGNESFTIRVGDRLFDGEVQEIRSGEVLFRQRINDPTLPRNYREVSILQNPDEEGNR